MKARGSESVKVPSLSNVGSKTEMQRMIQNLSEMVDSLPNSAFDESQRADSERKTSPEEVKTFECMCGEALERTAKIRYTEKKVDVCCDECGKAVAERTEHYHCPNERPKNHLHGWDYCVECVSQPKEPRIERPFRDVASTKHIGGREDLHVSREEYELLTRLKCPRGCCNHCENSHMRILTVREVLGDVSFVCTSEDCKTIVTANDYVFSCRHQGDVINLPCRFAYYYCTACMTGNPDAIREKQQKWVTGRAEHKTGRFGFYARFNHRPNLEQRIMFKNYTREDKNFPNIFGDKVPLPKRYWYWQKGRRNARRIIFVDGKVKDIMDVNTQGETFIAKFHLYCNWLASYDEVKKWLAAEKDPKKKKSRKAPPFMGVEIENIKEYGGNAEPPKPASVSLRVGYSVIRKSDFQLPGHPEVAWAQESEYGIRNDNNTAWNISPNVLGFDPRFAFWWRCKLEWNVTLVEEFELSSFPLDCQNFTIRLRAKRPINAVDILPYPRYGHYLSMASEYSILQEWKVHRMLVEFVRKGSQGSKVKSDYAHMAIHVKAERRWDVQKFNFVVLFCMCCLGMCTFAIDAVEDEGVRLGYIVTLLLADVATQQLIAESMPKIPYLTFMDWYTYCCFVFLVLIVAWSGVAAWLNSAADEIACGVFGVLLAILHAETLRRFKSLRDFEQSKLRKCDAELEELYAERRKQRVNTVPTTLCKWGDERLEEGNANVCCRALTREKHKEKEQRQMRETRIAGVSCERRDASRPERSHLVKQPSIVPPGVQENHEIPYVQMRDADEKM